jgi:hypothetical protein
MSVYRCNNCTLVAEEVSQPAGIRMPCANCKATVTLFSTAFYITKLVERHQTLSRELETLKQQEDLNDQEVDLTTAIPSTPVQLLPDQIQNTSTLSTQIQHQPLLGWFSAQRIKVNFDYSLVDTTGFFDEAAISIGDQYEHLASSLEQLRHAYRQERAWINIDLNNKSQQQQQILKSVLRQLYSQTFFARYAFQKKKSSIGLALQPAQTIRRFYDGGWLEWWALIRMLEICLAQGVDFSCTRGARIEFQNEELRELDVVFLLNKRFPIIIECKSGEFRPEIEKYVKLRRRLKIDKSQFVICNPDLTDEQASALTAMYELTFLNLRTFSAHMKILTG